MRRRSLSVLPPQIPNLSWCASAYSRHSRATGHVAHTSFASLTDSPRDGKNRCTSPLHLACARQ